MLMHSILDLNEIAHDDDMINTSMAIMPFVDTNDIITSQREMVNDLGTAQGENDEDFGLMA